MENYLFTRNDKEQMERHGVTEDQVLQQINDFKTGFPFSPLAKPCFPGQGIFEVSDELKRELLDIYQINKDSKILVKFVPASGAATRMFKNLFEYVSGGANEEIPTFIRKFLNEIEKFAFYHDLREVLLSSSIDVSSLSDAKRAEVYIDYLLQEKGLNYGSLPKGLLKFHRYASGEIRTPVQEHVIEGLDYATVNNGLNIHFTVSPEHKMKFQQHVADFLSEIEKTHHVKITISYSEQKPSTDTVAVDLENNLFREEDNQLVFRPAGHGALLENLNDLNADIIFIKNIDNVVPDHLKSDTLFYNKLMAGLLIKVQSKIFEYLRILDKGASGAVLAEINAYIVNTLGISMSPNVDSNTLTKILNRPIRICGMVKSDGNPGGGPFWVKNNDGTVALQIVETAQIDESNTEQKHILNSSTYFNPVELVCGVRNYKNEKFNLLEFRDPSTGFITKKSKNGKDLKAMELPGLWNGSMAFWNTIFIEVPISTFAPVKTVNDLLSPEHQ